MLLMCHYERRLCENSCSGQFVISNVSERSKKKISRLRLAPFIKKGEAQDRGILPHGGIHELGTIGGSCAFSEKSGEARKLSLRLWRAL
jgi:hypothetical protein